MLKGPVHRTGIGKFEFVDPVAIHLDIDIEDLIPGCVAINQFHINV